MVSFTLLGRSLMIVGGLLLLVGAWLFFAGRLLHLRAGPLLPGDILFKKGSLTIFFPLVTCLVLSILLTLLLNLLAILRR